MVHECNIHCRALSSDQEELLGMEDQGKWLPFIFEMEMIEGAKQASDDEDNPVFNCTTLYCKSGDSYNIDTPYEVFFKKFTKYVISKTK